jgi:hypothetical protein
MYTKFWLDIFLGCENLEIAKLITLKQILTNCVEGMAVRAKKMTADETSECHKFSRSSDIYMNYED